MSDLIYREPMEGTPFGRYQLMEVIGRGGMGEVWRAHDSVIDRVVAVKMLLPHYAQDPEFTERFRREARAAARLDDPHIVPIYDVGEIDGRLYVAMRLIKGSDLQTLLDAGPLDPARAVHIVEQVASALNSAHRAGLVHRDVKPSNILLADNNSGADFAYLIDFGIARTTSDFDVTSASSDVSALTCVLYQCLTADVPHPGDTLVHVAGGHMMAMDRVIATGLAKKPAEHYEGTVALATAAREALTAPIDRPDPAYAQPYGAPRAGPSEPDGPQRGRRTGLVVSAAAAVALLVVAGVVAAVQFTRDDDATVATGPTSDVTSEVPTPPPNTGPLTGTYRAEFEPITGLDDVPGPDRSQPTDTYSISSTCRPTGCVATAARIAGTTAFSSPMVLDMVGERWIAVGLTSVPCKGAPIEAWEVLILQPRPNGSLMGEYSQTTADECLAKRTVTLTRTGDADLDGLPDVNALPPRVNSPAEALRGWYHHTRAFPAMGQRQEVDYHVRTDCLRTGDRCISFFNGRAGEVLPLVFRDGAWNFRTRTEMTCRGAPMDVEKQALYPLPQPSQDPIAALNGHGRQDQTGSCAITVEFDDTLTRTGD